LPTKSLRGRIASGPWRRTYVVGAVIALYLNVFVLIAQFFMKIPTLKALAPTQSEPSFLGTQVVVMVIFIVLGVLVAKRFPAEAVYAA
jgi:ABC-type protease/lipase transport system fused ATPase/permease subunit